MKIKHWIIIIALIILDQITKILLINKNIAIIPNIFEITYVENFKAAFGIGERFPIIIISIIFIVMMLLFVKLKKEDIKNYTPFVLILSGSIGNLIDRIFRGHVIDFINVKAINYPVFNIADILVFIGVFTFVYFIIYKKSYIKI